MILVGVVHRDPFGYEKLHDVLFSLRPQAITVEISPLAIRFRTRFSVRMQMRLLRNLVRLSQETGEDPHELCNKGAFKEVSLQVALPFEYLAAKDAHQEFGARVMAVDSSRHAQPRLRHLKGLLSLENLRSLSTVSSFALTEKSQMEYRRAEWYMANPDRANDLFLGWDEYSLFEWEEREKHMAHSINGALRSLEEAGVGTLVHIGGWMHVVTGRMEKLLRMPLRERLLLSERNPFSPGS